jgi:hypothetical protein
VRCLRACGSRRRLFSGTGVPRPRTVVLQQELVAAGRVLERDDEAGAGAEDAHARRRLVPPRDALQLVPRPHAEDGAHLQRRRVRSVSETARQQAQSMQSTWASPVPSCMTALCAALGCSPCTPFSSAKNTVCCSRPQLPVCPP